jgi:uncharacterized membrane protein
VPDVTQLLAPLFALLALILVALLFYVLIVVIARTLHRFMPATPPPRDPAIEALRTRLAQGDIDELEYQRLRSILQGH